MYRLIIIDDDSGTSNNLGNYFPWEEHSFQVVGKFYDGYSAYQFLLENQVDLVLSDIKMPVMDGIELARLLNEQKRKEKIIFISGYKDFEYAQKAMEFGVSYYCLKPVTYREIKQKLSNIRQLLEQDKNRTDSILMVSDEQLCIQKKQVRKIKDYVKADYKDVTLDKIADYMKMNPSYLSRYFKENAGVNLFQYITCIRMKKALEFLQNEEYRTIYEISEKVGYSNSVSFTKTFRKQYGVTPSQYRNKFTCITADKEYEE